MAGEKSKSAEKQQASIPEEAQRKLEGEIRLEAYCRYQWRCESHEPGSASDDWLAAEQVVLARHVAPHAQPAPGPAQ